MLTREQLVHEYHTLDKSVATIAAEQEVTVQAVYYWLNQYEVGRKPRAKDRTGERHGRWTILGPTRHGSGGGLMWLCRCDCGTEQWHLTSHVCRVRDGKNDRGCNDCGIKKRRRGGFTRRIYNKIKHAADVRNLEFAVSHEFLEELFVKQDSKCALSGLPIKFAEYAKLETRHRALTASLDRIDSSKGYTPDNVQWVHKSINWMKGALPQPLFVALCESVYRVQAKNSKPPTDNAIRLIQAYESRSKAERDQQLAA
jgi:hypothetical protein